MRPYVNNPQLSEDYRAIQHDSPTMFVHWRFSRLHGGQDWAAAPLIHGWPFCPGGTAAHNLQTRPRQVFNRIRKCHFCCFLWRLIWHVAATRSRSDVYRNQSEVCQRGLEKCLHSGFYSGFILSVALWTGIVAFLHLFWHFILDDSVTQCPLNSSQLDSNISCRPHFSPSSLVSANLYVKSETKRGRWGILTTTLSGFTSFWDILKHFKKIKS